MMDMHTELVMDRMELRGLNEQSEPSRCAEVRVVEIFAGGRKTPYRDLARMVGVSEATIKRDLSRGSFSLRRLDQICAALGVGLGDLVQVPADRELVTELRKAQEIALAGDPSALLAQ